MIRLRTAVALLLASLSSPASAESLKAMDFAYGLLLELEAGQPVQSLSIPDQVYRSVTQPGLTDLRIVNAEGVPVAHAFCDPPADRQPPLESIELPAFQLRSVDSDRESNSDLEVIGPDGSRITVSRPLAERDVVLESRVTGHVFDLRDVEGSVEAISPLWRSVDQDSEVSVRVQGSNDLQDWKTLVASATLLRVQASDAVIERNRILLPQHRYLYLRFERSGDGSALEMDRALIDFRAREQRRSEKTSVEALLQPSIPDVAKAEKTEFIFFAEHRAQFGGFVLALPEANMALEVALESRSSAGADWMPRWRGTVSTVGQQAALGRFLTQRVGFPPRAEQHWRLRVLRGRDSLSGRQPGLRLDFDQRTIRFLAQGQGPFTLAYGSAHVRKAPQDCSTLMEAVAAKEIPLGVASVVGSPMTLAGPSVLISPPEEKPAISAKTLLMWAALIAGAAAILFLALKLLRESMNG